MFNCWYVIVIALSIYHETNATKFLTRQCTASQGKCALTKNANCESSFGSGWTANGSCCRMKPCCVFQCQDIPPDSLTNGTVTVTERNIGSTTNFACDAGHSLVGKASITCTASGWDGYIPQCTKIICPETVAFFRGSKYIFKCDISTWYDSENYCYTNGGQLTSIETGDENSFLLDVMALMKTKELIANVYFWIGLTDNNGEMSYKWLSGEPLNYSNWYQEAPQQPDNSNIHGETDAHCASIHFLFSLNWADEWCNEKYYSVCEIRLT